MSPSPIGRPIAINLSQEGVAVVTAKDRVHGSFAVVALVPAGVELGSQAAAVRHPPDRAVARPGHNPEVSSSPQASQERLRADIAVVQQTTYRLPVLHGERVHLLQKRALFSLLLNGGCAGEELLAHLSKRRRIRYVHRDVPELGGNVFVVGVT